MSDTTVLRTFSNEAAATIAAATLDAHGIPSQVLADNAGGALPFMSVMFPIRLVVRSEDADEARAILDGPAPAPE